ncbi:PhoH family protein [Roseburia sp. AM51-8]|jgi:phosphate starvation-inducible PhoH-like protein|uniref:PhoH-like protein n=1 Tax=Roseburia lenta TaxID=2763061 RepID=A0ABR7GCF3_9FIRM|nr:MULTISPECIES: PhoH family protein [Roseburia]MBC5685121.1 PhoH family protein [Roseburia lenta]RHO32212.1 PhoH family protein [Roseburia sp. AM16-25]RHQ02518.1 PhoH family protein [Roseburia sp. AM51-8]
MSEKECILDIPVEHLENIFGQFDANIKLIEQTLSVTFIARDDRLKVIGEEDKIKSAADIMQRLYALSKKGETITKQEVNYLLGLTEQKLPTKAVEDLADDCICHTTSGKPIKPKTIGQKAYVDAIRDQMITFGIGPAGTGKTYLAMAMAITAFQREEVSRIILTRPAIEAGEKLGFLPGDMQSKVDPYLRPLYDALYQIMGAESFARNMEKGLIEVAPLAYMRGRTLDNAFIILDEAQNTTPAQMKMFLTRIGFGSKAVITGDATQKDLPASARSGLDVAVDVLSSVDEISICKLSGADVVRHPLVQKIVHAYEVYEKKEDTKNKKKKVGKTHGKDRGRK